MSFKFRLFLIVLVSLINQNLKSQAGIKGHIIIDTSIWAPIAYLSMISDFDDMYTMSHDMIIEKANIDVFGNFCFNTLYFPDEDNLFRIHISKNNDPPASLIIGGKDENHFFVISNKKSQVIIKDSSNSEFIKDIAIYGYYPNQMLQHVDKIANYLDTINFNGAQIKIELIRNAICEKLRSFADTCSNPLISLYALYKSKFEKNYPVNQQFYKNFLSKWSQQRSSYFIEFRKRIPTSENNGKGYHILIGVSFLIIGFTTGLAYLKLFKKKPNLLQNLSVQERKIFALIIEGKSNKEISDILNIGLSTVKSHINSIYSKLAINSRKDILNLDLDKKDNGI